MGTEATCYWYLCRTFSSVALERGFKPTIYSGDGFGALQLLMELFVVIVKARNPIGSLQRK